MNAAERAEAERIFEFIGAIYDCAIDPARWDATLDDLRRYLECANVVLAAADLTTGEIRLQKALGIDPHWLARVPEVSADLIALYHTVPGFADWPIDEPMCPSRHGDMRLVQANRYYRDWARPQGLIEAVAVFLMRSREWTAEIGFGRHESAGWVTDREIRILRLLAPHLRRAVAISDLIDMKSIESESLGHALDALSVAIVLVDGKGKIVHANAAASRMFERGSPIESVRGTLRAVDATAWERLRHMIAEDQAPTDRAMGVALRGVDGGVATAHVLPLALGTHRGRLFPAARAAIFIATRLKLPFDRLQAVADAFGLTPAETRLLERMMQGDTLAEAAAAMNVAMTTVRTHRSRLLAKTGVQRQASLVALAHQLVPPIRAQDTTSA
jgi:DNA-binding CsgD family transcriptional regulator/PAS domain-containing protein